MKRLYDLSGADPTAFVHQDEIIETTEISKLEAQGIAQYLKSKFLLKYAASGPLFNITAEGIDKVENAISHPKRETDYFGQVINILNINSVEGSQIQQNTTSSSQIMEFKNYDVSELTKLVKSLKDALSELKLNEESKNVYLSDLKTIEAQIESPKPKENVIRSCLLSIKQILRSVAESSVAAGLLKILASFV